MQTTKFFEKGIQDVVTQWDERRSAYGDFELLSSYTIGIWLRNKFAISLLEPLHLNNRRLPKEDRVPCI